MNIELRKREGRFVTQGDRLIFVDGKQWGDIKRISHGLWGSTYRFHNAVGHQVGELDRRRRR